MTNSSARALEAYVVTPSDTAEVGYRGLYIGGAGNVQVLPFSSPTPVTFVNVAAGSFLPIQVKKVYSTNTTATNIVGLR